MKKSIFGFTCLLFVLMVNAQNNTTKAIKPIKPAAYRTEAYLPLLKNKRVGIFANHTATIGNIHLVDSLQKLGVNIVVAFAPEHGFRGKADAGEDINNYKDAATGIPVISLYGKKSYPSAEDLKEVDILLFDIQDVGLRYYTYISSLQQFIETAFENNKPLIILDRPNPNGFYVDGPVLDTAYKSFVGMQPIPIVYGMTIGEYATMITAEKWLASKANEKYASFDVKEKRAHLIVIPCENYTHQSKYILPIKPSPNLPDMSSIYWYGSTCFFEGTFLSEGRGTDHPFAIFGSPLLPSSLYSFTPTSREGAKEPKLKDQICFGWNLSGTPENVLKQIDHKVQIQWIIKAYQQFPNKDAFFLKPATDKPTAYYFNKLAGNKELMEQIKAGTSEADIRKSWEPKLHAFKTIRKKYLLYPDFE
ncbi:MAG: DUF1343 domain-containing protein [Bacteroidota bacterium]